MIKDFEQQFVLLFNALNLMKEDKMYVFERILLSILNFEIK